MEVEPELIATRVAQLKPGDLFVFPSWLSQSYALKVVDPAEDGDTFIVPLGPKFPSDPHQPRLYAEQAGTTISFGKEFIFKFSVIPEAWSENEGQFDCFCAALVEGEAYLRANCDRYAGGYKRCWIRLSTGIISHHNLPGIAAYSTRWEIMLPQGQLPPKPLLQHAGKPLPAN